MKLAIMQPYFFPYIGYFQMLSAVETFVFLDNVNFIKKGWIHRNNIFLEGKDHPFRLPLKKASQNKLICNIDLHESYDEWKEKFKKTLHHAYRKTENFDLVYPKVCNFLDYYSGKKGYSTQLHKFCADSINLSARLLGISTKTLSSCDIDTGSLSGEARILRICQKRKATHYINAIGGKKLYNQEVFDSAGVDLRFLRCDLEPSENFNPYRSILDLLFRYSLDEVKEMLYAYKLER